MSADLLHDEGCTLGSLRKHRQSYFLFGAAGDSPWPEAVVDELYTEPSSAAEDLEFLKCLRLPPFQECIFRAGPGKLGYFFGVRARRAGAWVAYMYRAP